MFNPYKLQIKKTKLVFIGLMLTIFLSACGGGESTTSFQQTGTVTGTQLGCGSLNPAPATADINSFCNELWSKSNLQNNCASCHKEDQTPYFMRDDDINLAYAAINPYIDRTVAGNSAIVAQVFGTAAAGDGHHCWASDDVCADLMTNYIEAWVGSTAGSAKTITLTAPANPSLPGSGKAFPATATTATGGAGTSFEELIYTPILSPYCVSCHATGPGDPLFAGPDVETSYLLSQSKINLDVPASSRFVTKLLIHGNDACWNVNPVEFPDITVTGDECTDSAAAMEDAITKFAAGITTNAIDPAVNVVSNAMTIPEGIIASGGARFEANQIALYEFKTGADGIAYDTSTAEPALNLSLQGIQDGSITWAGGWGIKISGNGFAQASSTQSKKLYDLIQATGEYSIEAWVAPDNVTQMNSRIVSYGKSTSNRNFSLSQSQYNYDFLGRNSLTDLNGTPAVSTPDAAEVLQATLQHVVATYDPVNGRQVYVNGVLRTTGDTQAGGSLDNWELGSSLVLGNETSGAGNNVGLWKGTIKMVSIHNRALSEAEINQNLIAGVGEKFFLLFGIGHIANVPANTYIMFEVSQFDDYSYLFTDPKFVSLDTGLTSISIPIKGMRIGVNSQESPVGQAYVHLDTTITANNQSLSTVGTTIPLEQGPNVDEFFLTFEVLGSATHTPPVISYTAPAPANDKPTSDIGLKTFDEINTTMSAMTGISPQTVSTGYNNIKQQLPVAETIDGFLPSHQIAITQLAMEYCDALVENASARDAYFPGFSNYSGVNKFNETSGTALNDAAEQDAVIDPLLSRINGVGMQLQPDIGTFATGGTTHVAGVDTYTAKSELVYLMNNLTTCGACADSVAQTSKIVKATCTAAMASAISLLQ